MAVYSGGSLRNKTNPYRKEKQKEFEKIEKIVEKMTRENNHGKSGRIPLFLLNLVVFVLFVAGLLGYGIYCLWQNASTRNTQKELQGIREEADTSAQYEVQFDENGLPIAGIAAALADIYKDTTTREQNKNGCLILDTDL